MSDRRMYCIGICLIVSEWFIPLIGNECFAANSEDISTYNHMISDPVLISDETSTEYQQFPDVAYNSEDNTFLAVWENVLDENFFEIRGTLLDGENGVPIGEEQLLIGLAESVEAPEVTYNPNDNEFLVVARQRTEMSVARRVSAQGQPIGDVVEIDWSRGPSFFDPAARARVVSVVHNSIDNRYMIGLAGPPSAQILFPDLSLDIPVLQFGTGTNPSVAWSSESNVYLMAWEDREARSTGSENLSAQLISNNGDLIGDTIRLRDQDFAEESPRVVYNSDDDHFLVVWDERIGFADDRDPKTLTDLFGQILTAGGDLVGDPLPIEAGTAYTLRQDAVYNPVSQLYFVVWKGDLSGDFAFADIYGRFIRRDGTFFSNTFLIHDDGDDETDEGNSEQYFDESKLPAVEVNTQTGDFLVLWEEAGTNRDPFDRRIMGRLIQRQEEAGMATWKDFH